MLPTPCTAHVPFDTIYEPAEDSYLFLDTLSSASETAWLTQHFAAPNPSPTILEVGSGSGVVLAFLVAHSPTILGRADVLSLATDLNRTACLATRETVAKAIAAQQQQQQQQTTTPTTNASNPAAAPASHSPSPRANPAIKSTHLASVQSNLAAACKPGSIDILLFNPPYVPTDAVPRAPTAADFDADPQSRSEQFERESYLLSLTYAGGRDGMEITERLLADLPRVLSPRGVGYVLLCAQNRPREVVERIRGWTEGLESEGEGTTRRRWCAEMAGFSGTKAGWEKLVIVRVWREDL